MDYEAINAELRELAEAEYEARAAEYLEMLHEEDLADMMYHHDMMMYACHSYDNDAIAYGMQ